LEGRHLFFTFRLSADSGHLGHLASGLATATIRTCLPQGLLVAQSGLASNSAKGFNLGQLLGSEPRELGLA